MKGLVNKLISYLHYFIIAYGVLGVYEKYEAHTANVETLETSIPGIDDQIATTEKKVNEIQEFVKKADEYKVIVEEVAKNIESVQKQIPSEINDSQIMSYFNGEFEAMNIKEPQITPGKEEPGTYLISKDYNFKARGTYLQFLIFFERVGNAARIYNIKALKLTTNTDKKKGRFQMVNGDMVIQAYRFNPEFRVERGF